MVRARTAIDRCQWCVYDLASLIHRHNTGPRGLSNLGGIIQEAGTNAAGGRIFTSTGAINQNDFAGIVQSGLMKGDEVSILTGAHGLPIGSLIADASMLADDIATLGLGDGR